MRHNFISPAWKDKIPSILMAHVLTILSDTLAEHEVYKYHYVYITLYINHLTNRCTCIYICNYTHCATIKKDGFE